MRKKGRTVWRALQLVGLACLLIVVLTRVADAFHIFPVMGWGLPSSPGHYLDLVSAVLRVTLFSVGFLANALIRRL
jgi:hypothetical protein